MNALYRTVFYIAAFLLPGSLGAQTFGWVATGTGTSDIEGLEVITMPNHDHVAAGEFTGSANFGGTTLSGSSDTEIFVCRYDSSGNILWATSFASSDEVELGGLAAGPGNEIYLCGTFEGNLTLQSTILNNLEDENGFLARLDGSGNVVWGLNFESSDDLEATDLAVDGNGNISVVGKFEDDATLGTSNLTSSGDESIFVASFNNLGNTIWAVEGSAADEVDAAGIGVDGSGNLVIAGEFEGALQLGTTNLSNLQGTDLFLAQLNPSGNFAWAIGIGSSSEIQGTAVDANAAGDIYLTGAFEGAANFSTTTLNSAGDKDGFLARFNTMGNEQWISHFSSIGEVESNDLHVSSGGEIFVTGAIAATTTFDSLSVSNNTGQDLFIAAYNASGSVAWAKGVGGTSVTGNAVTADLNDNPVLSGAFTTQAFFDTITVNGGADNDFFLGKIFDGSPVVSRTDPEQIDLSIHAYPNPFRSALALRSPHQALPESWKLVNAQGKFIREVQFHGPGFTAKLEQLPPGLYFLVHEELGVAIRAVKTAP